VQRTTLDEALEYVAAEPVVWTRFAAAADENDSWSVRLFEITSGPHPPPSWEPRAWTYPSVIFEALAEPGPAVADWIRAGRVVARNQEFALAERAASIMWERRQSGSLAPYETLDWPVTEATLSQPLRSYGEPQGHLMSADDAPSFVNFYTAAASFFWLNRQPVGGSLHQGVMYRHQDGRGRINRVRITGDEVKVEIEGSALDGMIVELASDLPGQTQRAWDRTRAGSDTLTFILDDGLPPGAWLLLRLGVEWIDRRFLSVPWSRGGDAGVEVVVEPDTKLEAFLANREGPQVEFKRQVPSDDGGKAKVMKTVCAFANGQGGSVLFGIDDDHNVIGVHAQRVDRLQDQLIQTIGSWIDPRPNVTFEIMPTVIADAVVLEMRVASGTRLYGCAHPGEVPAAYIRHHAISVKARPSEIEEIVGSRTQISNVPPWVVP